MTGALLARVVQDLRAALEADPVPSRLALHHVVQDVVARFPACVLVADGAGQLVAASDEALRMLGYTLPSLRELNVTQLAAEDEAHEVERLWESFLQHRRQTGTFALRHRNGSIVRTHYAAATNAVADLSVAVHVVQEAGAPAKMTPPS